jgi:hypothetical protein
VTVDGREATNGVIDLVDDGRRHEVTVVRAYGGAVTATM